MKASTARFHITKHRLRNYVAGTELRYRAGLVLKLTINCATLEVNVFRNDEAWICDPCYSLGNNTWYDLTWSCVDPVNKTTKGKKIQLHPHGGIKDTDNSSQGFNTGGGQVSDATGANGNGGNSQVGGLPGATKQDPIERKSFVVVIQKRDTDLQRMLPGMLTYTGQDGKALRQGEMSSGTLYGGSDLGDFEKWRQQHFRDTGEWIEVVPKDSVQYLPSGWSDTEYALGQEGVYYDKYLATVSTPVGMGNVDPNSDIGWNAFVESERRRLHDVKDRVATEEETNLLDLTEGEIFS